METAQLVDKLKTSLDEIPQLKKIREGLKHPHVKSWKTKLEEILVEGGTTCDKTLQSLRKMKRELSGSDFIRFQTYANHLDALERNLKQTIQTIQVLGRPEDKNDLPNWGRPKSQMRAVGCLKVGDEEIATSDISIHEVLDCLVSLAEDTNSLTETMSGNMISCLRSLLDDDLLQPFLSQKLDVLLGHWPEFQTKD